MTTFFVIFFSQPPRRILPSGSRAYRAKKRPLQLQYAEWPFVIMECRIYFQDSQNVYQ